MAEWKTDTEEVKKVVEKCREFKRSLQEERCFGFIKDLDSYAQKIIVERRKIEMQLQNAREELKKAKSNEDDAKVALRVLQGASILSCIWSPARIATATAVVAAEVVLKFMKEDTEKCKRNVELLEQALEIYSTQAKASVDLVNQAWEGVKKRLHFYTDKHQEFIRRLNYASAAIDNEYNIATPESLKERDFESPKIAYTPKKSVFDERLKDLREDFSFSLYADLKDKIHHNALSNDELERAKASKERELENLEDLMGASSYDENPNNGLDRLASSKEQEFEKSLEDLMPSVLSVPSYNESLTLAKKNCVKNCKKALEGFTEKIKEAPNDSNAINEAFDSLETELERATENLSQKIDPVLERNENYTQKALEYREFLEGRKEGFIVDEKTPIRKKSALMSGVWRSLIAFLAPLCL